MTLKDEQFETLIENLKLGMNITDSCELAGTNYDTYYSWKTVNQKRWNRCQQAILEPKKRCISIVQRAAITTWQAAAWWLERKYKPEFSQQMNLAGDKDNPLIVRFDKDDEKL